MAVSAAKYWHTIIWVSIILLLNPNYLFCKERPVETKVVTELQDRYNSLIAPGIIMLPVNGTSIISAVIKEEIEKEFLKQIVTNGKLKPVLMQRWLANTFIDTKASNPFSLINAIKAEQYLVPLQYIGKLSLFKGGSRNFLLLNVYPLATYYPISILRVFSDQNEIPDIISSCIEEMNMRLFQPVASDTRKRIIIDPFKLEFLRLVELKSGEFDFISTPFIEQEGTTLRDGDDLFSSTLAYILNTTNLFRIMQTSDFREYTAGTISTTTTAVDYRIQGRVQISEQKCVLYVDVLDIHAGNNLASIRYPLPKYSFDRVWAAYRDISVQLASKLLGSDSYSMVPVLKSPGCYFYAQGMFVGWDVLENYVLAKGLHVINTSVYHKPIKGKITKTNATVYYVQLDALVTAVYTDKAGEHLWNLLKK